MWRHGANDIDSGGHDDILAFKAPRPAACFDNSVPANVRHFMGWLSLVSRQDWAYADKSMLSRHGRIQGTKGLLDTNCVSNHMFVTLREWWIFMAAPTPPSKTNLNCNRRC